MSKRRHVIAMAVCVAVALAMLVSSAYIVHEAAHHHDCPGEDCPICQLIAEIARTRRELGAVVLLLLLGCFMLSAPQFWHAAAETELPALGTLVSRKIRLND